MMPVSKLAATSVSIMKHPPRTTENFEFNLGKSPDLRCLASRGTTICTKCESCVVRTRLIETRQWFLRAGEKSKRRFLLGLVRRFHSANLFAYVVQILKPLCGKDYLYSRSRANPGLDGDHIDAGHDRALRNQATEETIQDSLRWFSAAPYWSKSNYILGVLQMCSGELVHAVNKLAQTMLNNEKQKQIMRNRNVDYENESLVDTEFSFQSHKHPETNLLRAASSVYSHPISPFGEGDYLEPDHVVVEDESEDTLSEVSSGSSVHSLDPTLRIMAAADSALLGVRQHVDFIRRLPVHLSKYILSFMEYGDLVSCFEVSPHWCYVAKEVEEDMKMRQIIWEEVMLMQGSSAKGGNPVFANHIDIPVPRLAGDSYDVLLSDDPPEEVNFKSDISLSTSYSGLVTHDVEMEERNIYCGAYNVMVLSDQQDINRVVHYNFGQLVAIGSFDRHVRFLDVISGQETGPLITGHAGSIKSLYINEARGFVISGSFDTSIRCWDIASGRPMKHFHGHMGTILCLDMYEDTLVSGSKDNQVKVWNFESGKCKRTFKHRHQINAVAVHRDTVVSGCEEGKVKVWSIKDACLLKVLFRSPKHLNRFGLPNPNTHQGPIASVKVDDWHIISGSMDGYALVWSALGNHDKCVNALRHPKAVLCVHMAYLRLVTGCEDGKLRIWNMLTGDCLRVLRGNSRSDPIVAIHPCGERLLLQTITNLLMLCFEEVEWNYGQSEKIELLRYKNRYGDAPLRQQSYSLVRAQRGQLAGAVNQKIISHSAPQRDGSNVVLTHSSRSLSDKSLQKARKNQEVCVNVTLTQNVKGPLYHNVQGPRQAAMDDRTDLGLMEVKGQTSTYRVNSRPPTGRSKSSVALSGQGSSVMGSRPSSGATQSVKMSRSDAATPFSSQSRGASPAFSKVSFTDVGIRGESINRRPTTAMSSPSAQLKSTKFRLPQRGHSAPVRRDKSPSDAVSLSEAKALLRSQQRVAKEGVTRDRLLLTWGNMEQSKKNSDVVNNTIANALQIDYVGYAAPSTAYSTPSTLSSSNSSTISRVPVKKSVYPRSPKLPIAKEIVVKTIEHIPQEFKHQKSIHPKTVESTVPRANVVRPQTAQVVHRSEMNVPSVEDTGGGKASLRRCKSETAMSSASMSAPLAHFEVSHIVSPVRKKKSHGWTTSHTEPVTIVPMLMRQRGSGSTTTSGGVSPGTRSRTERPSTTGRLSMIQKPVQDPLTNHGEFQVRTRQQTQDYLQYVTGIQEKYLQEQDEEERRMQRKMWLQMAKGRRSSSVPPKKSTSSK
ncbi:F-box and WD repeat domain containing protein 10B-like [Diadema setosum]|uniref:F-box and WD repeat domain containing protein 10B-like n=1 Tax=Diadema setosum TaxID=31175 RepID=UPI003B3A6474